jgi:hypothetical protein
MNYSHLGFFIFVLVMWIYFLNLCLQKEKPLVKPADLQTKNVHLVVSRYNEDIDWINEEPFRKYPIVLYEKGPTSYVCDIKRCKRFRLPNIGRCDHTYLYYIITHYHNLPDIILFLPGSVRMPDKLFNANRFLSAIESDTVEDQFRVDPSVDLKPNFYDFQLDEWMASDIKNQTLNREKILKRAKIRPFGKWFEHHFSKKQKLYNVWYTGVILTTRERIHQNSLDFYRELIKDLETHSNPEAGHYMERAWFTLFCDKPTS